MRVLLVVNPTASAFATHHRLAVEKILGQDHDVTVVETRERCHAVELAKQAAADGVDTVAVLAGDGTLNEAANGLVGTSTALGVLPGGSTNVFARTIGMGRRPAIAAERLRRAMAGGERRRIGLGVANGRHFLFHVGMGFDAAVVQKVEDLEERLPLKRTIGQLSFAMSAVNTWICGYDRSQPRFTVRVTEPDNAEEIEGVFAICLNTNPYTYFGPRPLDVDPTASLDSPLSLAVFRDLDLATLGSVFAAALAGGRRLADVAAVEIRSSLHAVTVEGHRPFPWQIDGDLAGTSESLELSYDPACLDLFVPSDQQVESA